MTKEITPELFFSEEPPQRIVGVECEYNIQAFDHEGSEVSLYRYIAENAIRAAGLRNIGQFLSNGAKLYVDVDHLEYCTPESLGPYQAAAADMAGIQVMKDIVERSEVEHRGIYRISGSTIDEEKKQTYTNGVHENYMIPASIAYDHVMTGLLSSHLGSRVWAMNGNVSANTYEFSQKINGIGGNPFEWEVQRQTTSGRKPMALLRTADDDTVGDNRWMRAEVRFADPQQSYEGRKLSLASTSVVLHIAEQQKLLQRAGLGNFDDIIIHNPVPRAKEFMKDLSLKGTAETLSGRKVTALDIGEQLALKALALSELILLPSDELDGAHNWIATIDALRRSNPAKAQYDPYLLQRFDIAAKHHVLRRTGSFEAGDAVAKARSLQWDRIIPRGIGMKYFDKISQTDTSAIEQLKTTAPKTRAKIRAEYITKHSDDDVKKSVSWAYAGRGTLVKSFSDPYGYKAI